MKRKNYILLIAAAMLASSCANDDVIDTSAKVEMKFRVTADSPTRAANAYCNNNLPQTFTLSCDQGQQAYMPIFSNEKLTRNGDYYTFDNPNTFYWAYFEATYLPYIFYGSNAPTPTLPTTPSELATYDEDQEGYHYLNKYFDKVRTRKNHIIHSPKANASEQIDLLFAKIKVKPDDGIPTNGVVNLNFAHLLSKVVFYAKVTDEHLLVQIDEVKVCNVYTKGRFEMFNYDGGETNGNINDHTGGATAPLYLDNLDLRWYANASRTADDTQHSGQGAYEYTTETISPMVEVSTLDTDGKSISDETNSAEGHTTSANISHTLMLIPQVTNAWEPSAAGMGAPTAEGQTGSYFLVKCRIWDVKNKGVLVDPKDGITPESSVELWPNKSGYTTEYIAIPFAADWKLGRKYVYTFVFGNSTGFGGYNPTTGEKVLVPIKLTCSVDDFASVDKSGDLDR